MAIYPCRLVLYSAHGNEYIDLHFRPQPEVADGDDNISPSNKVVEIKNGSQSMDKHEGR